MSDPKPKEVFVSSMSKVANDKKQTVIRIEKSEIELILNVEQTKKLIQDLQIIMINE